MRELESRPPKLLLPEIPHDLDIYAAERIAARVGAKIERWERELAARKNAAQFLRHGEAVYDMTNGRIGSVECVKAARYLEGAARSYRGRKRRSWLDQAQMLDEMAHKIYGKKEQLRISPLPL